MNLKHPITSTFLNSNPFEPQIITRKKKDIRNRIDLVEKIKDELEYEADDELFENFPHFDKQKFGRVNLLEIYDF